MTCPEARELLSALLDEALSPSERQAVEAHLTACADCQRELAELRETVALLNRLPPAHAPAGFVDRVVEKAYRPSWPRRVADAVFRPLRVKLPLEAAAVVLVGISALYVYQRAPEVHEVARQEPRESPTIASPPLAARPAPSTGFELDRAPGRTIKVALVGFLVLVLAVGAEPELAGVALAVGAGAGLLTADLGAKSPTNPTCSAGKHSRRAPPEP